jgi:hypothetical protein
MKQTRDCSGSLPWIGGSSGSSAIPSISMMEPTSMVVLVPLRMQSGSGSITMSPSAPYHCTTSPTANGLTASSQC